MYWEIRDAGKAEALVLCTSIATQVRIGHCHVSEAVNMLYSEILEYFIFFLNYV